MIKKNIFEAFQENHSVEHSWWHPNHKELFRILENPITHDGILENLNRIPKTLLKPGFGLRSKKSLAIICMQTFPFKCQNDSEYCV